MYVILLYFSLRHFPLIRSLLVSIKLFQRRLEIEQTIGYPDLSLALLMDLSKQLNPVLKLAGNGNHMFHLRITDSQLEQYPVNPSFRL